jgi:carbamoyl-phosphate synthase/aspartate carbamoyltransferase/dihydroorotase
VEDREALWENLEVIDCFATDHAPHTIDEKDSQEPPPGFPGLETSLSLMLQAVSDGRMTMDDLVSRMYHNPARIFGIPLDENNKIEVDTEVQWEVKGEELFSRCGWSPFEGMNLEGKVRRVIMRGQIVFEDGKVIAQPGFGRDISPNAEIEY